MNQARIFESGNSWPSFEQFKFFDLNRPTLPCQAQTLTNSCEVPPNMLSHPNPINPPHAPFGSFEKTY